MNEEPRFHFKIKLEYASLKDGQCCQEVYPSIWNTHRCTKVAIENIDGVGLCKTHAKILLKWRN